jgi:hypothetical protein
MKPARVDDLVVEMAGCVRPPDDLVNAARQSLDPDAFDELMRETNGSPTAEQLVAKVESRRISS